MYDKLIYTKNLTVHCFRSPRLRTRPPPLPPQQEFPLIHCNNHLRLNEMNGSFRPPLYTYRLNWTRETSWQWWDEWNDAALQTQNSKFLPWRSEAEHDTTRSRRLSTISKTDDTKKLRKSISSYILYPSSHFLWHHVPHLVPHLVQEYWGFFNAGTSPFPHGKETVSHCDRPWHFLQWQHGVNIKHWSVPLPHLFHQISTCSLPRLFQPHCDVQDSFLFPPCWCCVHDWNCREVDSAGACWLWFIASRFRSQLIYIATPSQLFTDTFWHLILYMPIEQRW